MTDDDGFGWCPRDYELDQGEYESLIAQLCQSGLRMHGRPEMLAVDPLISVHFRTAADELVALLGDRSLRVLREGPWLAALRGRPADLDRYFWMTVDVPPRGGGDAELHHAITSASESRRVDWWRAILPRHVHGLFWSVQRPFARTKMSLREATWDGQRTLIATLRLTAEDARQLAKSTQRAPNAIELLLKQLESRYPDSSDAGDVADDPKTV